jgi:hypothetical protein
MKWESGRQDATQSLMKLKIWSKWNTDCYLLKLKEGSEIGEHLDPVKGKKHYRMNITIYGKWLFFKGIGGNYQTIGSCHLFRPDIVTHSAYVQKDTMVLSIGIAL